MGPFRSRHPHSLAALALAGLMASLGAAACSSSGSSASSQQGFAQQFCSLYEPCCADAGLPTSGQACTQLVGSTMATYNAASGQQCLNELKQAQSQPGFCALSPSVAPACSSVFSTSGSAGGNGSSAGSVPPGSACKTDADCTPASGGGATCLFDGFGDGGASQQVCVQTLPSTTAGQGPCIGTKNGSSTSYSYGGTAGPPAKGYICDNASGLSCDVTTMKCAPLVATGGACSSDLECTSADYCAFSSTGTSGPACAPRIADGSSCAGSLLSACQPTSYCNMTTSLCTASLPAGAACTTGEACASRLCSSGKCSSASSLTVGLLCGG